MQRHFAYVVVPARTATSVSVQALQYAALYVGGEGFCCGFPFLFSERTGLSQHRWQVLHSDVMGCGEYSAAWHCLVCALDAHWHDGHIEFC